ncbi:bifunctional diguanylate cyclase/phosphodiesterase [Amedibacillus sp. YH-ame6]
MRRKDYRTILQSIIIGAVCLLLLISVAITYMDYLNKNITSEITTTLKEVSNKNAITIRNKMHSNLELLDSFAEYIKYENLNDKKNIVDKLATVAGKNGYKRMGIADVNGDCYTTDGVSLNISEREYFQKAIKGERNVSAVLNDLIGEDKALINAYATPVYQDNTIRAVIFMVKTTKGVADNLLVTSFDGQGYSMLVDSQGKVVLRNNEDTNTYSNLDELMYDEEYRKIDRAHNEGVVSYHDDNNKYFMAYGVLGINDWVVVSVVPASVVSAQIMSFTQMAVLTWVIIILVFMILLFYIYVSWHRNNKKMQKVLFKDTLTGYDNFNKFKMDVESIVKLKKDTNIGSLIELDIEDFKMFNKIHGYEIGDNLLKNIMRCVNLYCGSNERCARISDDRFVVYWEDNDEAIITKRINQMYSNIIMIFETEYEHQGIKFQLCFGVYIMESGETNIMNCLDKAVYAKNYIKKNHEDHISFYNDEMYQKVLNEKYMLERLDKAINDGEFVVYLQPKVNVNTFEIVAAEALVRWRDPSRGLIPPGEFIPLFERNGALHKLDFYVFHKVCRTLKRWQNEHKKMITISVNISKSYMFSKGFAKRLHEIIESNHLAPEYLELEITESTMLENPNDLLAIIDELKGYGFKISMDDFGSGYSSLNMLKEVPIDVIKLDQVFFQHTEETKRKSNIIVAGLCQLIDMLHIETVAEGIENKEQLQFLKRVKCHVAQGFYFYRPMPITDLEAILNEQKQEHTAYTVT